MKELLWLGGVIGGSIENDLIQNNRNPFIIAQSNLEKAYLKGLQNKEIELSVYTIPTVPYYRICNQILQKKKIIDLWPGVHTQVFPVVNLFILRYFFISLYSFFVAMKFCMKNNDEKAIFIATNFLPTALPTIIVGKFFHVNVSCLFCDLIEDLYGRNISVLRKIYKKFTYWISSSYSSFVFVTEQMNVKINTKKKPFCIVEGIYNDTLSYTEKKRENIFIYSGSLIEKYGVRTSIELFKELKLENYELHIYGDGEYKDEMLNLIEGEKKIKYYGLVSREELFVALTSAKFLLNLRDPNEKFTYYSFPSKLFEYLASGACVISSRLMGIPSEYYQYLLTVDAINIEALKKDVILYLSYDDKKLKEIGINGRKFVINKKTPNIQAQILYDFLF